MTSRDDSVTPPTTGPTAGRVLVVDDEEWLAIGLARILERNGITTVVARDGREALHEVDGGEISAVISDIDMPGMSGVELLQRIHASDPSLPVMFITGVPDAESAAAAVEMGVYKYLTKPFDPGEVVAATRRALAMRAVAAARHQVDLAHSGSWTRPHDPSVSMLPGYEELDDALARIYLVHQPIVAAAPRLPVFGYEVLLRTENERWRRPDKLIGAARDTGLLRSLERRIRELAAGTERPLGAVHFVNLHPTSLDDPHLVDPEAPLSRVASDVVLEITEAAQIAELAALPATLGQLRGLGFRIALDDLGSGFASLNNLFAIEPDIVKLDMALVRSSDQDPHKRRLVRAIVEACRRMGVHVVAEGIETEAEFRTMVEIGCDLLQGYLFARPERELAVPELALELPAAPAS